MEISLRKAVIEDCPEIYDMQIKAFAELLDRYKDYDFSPGAERFEKTIERFLQPTTDYYFIVLGNGKIGAMRICNFGSLCKIKQLFVLPEFQGRGFAQRAITAVEALYPLAERWELDTILQEDRLRHLYEKLGYRKTGRIENIKEGMDLVFYAKLI